VRFERSFPLLPSVRRNETAGRRYYHYSGVLSMLNVTCESHSGEPNRGPLIIIRSTILDTDALKTLPSVKADEMPFTESSEGNNSKLTVRDASFRIDEARCSDTTCRVRGDVVHTMDLRMRHLSVKCLNQLCDCLVSIADIVHITKMKTFSQRGRTCLTNESSGERKCFQYLSPYETAVSCSTRQIRILAAMSSLRQLLGRSVECLCSSQCGVSKLDSSAE
jgi:hypothetical protein